MSPGTFFQPSFPNLLHKWRKKKNSCSQDSLLLQQHLWSSNLNSMKLYEVWLVGFNLSSLRAKSPQSSWVLLHLELTWDKAWVLSNGLLFSTAWLGSLRMRDAVNTQGSGPNRPALLLWPISAGMTDLLIPEPQVDTGDCPPPRLGFDLRSAGQEQLCLTCAVVACRVHLQPLAHRTELKPSIGADESWVYSWLKRYLNLGIFRGMCLYNR